MVFHLPNPISGCNFWWGVLFQMYIVIVRSLSPEFCVSSRGGQMPNHGDSQSRLRSDIYNLTSKENMLDELIRNAGRSLLNLEMSKVVPFFIF